MKKYLLFGFLLLALNSCQKDFSTSSGPLTPEEKVTLSKFIAEDPLLIGMCNASIESGEIIKNATKNGLKPEDIKKLDPKAVKNDQDLINALIELKIDGAEQLVKLKKDQENYHRDLVKKYPELNQFSNEEWKSINNMAFKKIYESQGKTFYSKPL